MAKLNTAARELIESGALAHLATIDADGSPQVSVVWVGLDGDDIVAAHLDPRQRKLAKTYIGPDAVFPPMPNPPQGVVNRITVTSVSGLGPWTD